MSIFIMARRVYRAVWMSDLHLGTRGCSAELILSFLKNVQTDTLYLVGDIIDGWHLTHRWYWPKSHQLIVDEILYMMGTGTRVVYVTGNHDEFLRRYVYLLNNAASDKLVVTNEAVHETLHGKRFLVIHGDTFDSVLMNHRSLSIVGDYAYTFLLSLHRLQRWVRHKAGYTQWSFAHWCKDRTKNITSFLTNFRETMVASVKKRGFDGVICGHLHFAEMLKIDGLFYINDGDGVESCTALLEERTGDLSLVGYHTDPPMQMCRLRLPEGTITPSPSLM